MKLLPIMLGAVIGVASGVIYLTQSISEEDDWIAHAPNNAAEWQENKLLTYSEPNAPHKFYDSATLDSELAIKDEVDGFPEALFSDAELAALLEQEQSEVD